MNENKAYENYNHWFNKKQKAKKGLVKMTKEQFREYRLAKRNDRNTKARQPQKLSEVISILSPEEAKHIRKQLDKKYLGELIKTKGKSYKDLKKEGVLK